MNSESDFNNGNRQRLSINLDNSVEKSTNFLKVLLSEIISLLMIDYKIEIYKKW